MSPAGAPATAGNVIVSSLDGSVGVFGHNDTGDVQVVEIEQSTGDHTTITVGPCEMFSVRQ